MNYELRSVADPAPRPAPAWVGNFVMSSISFYLPLPSSTFFPLIADPAPGPAPAGVGNLGDVLYLLLSSSIFFYLLLNFFVLFCCFCLLVILFFITFGGQIKYMFH
jgi:hypothetical protein